MTKAVGIPERIVMSILRLATEGAEMVGDVDT